MTAASTKVVRDFWQERTRTLLVVLAIALGVAAFSTVLSAYAILVRELDRGYLATNPASATLRTDSIDDDLVRAVLSGHGVSDAEPRRVVTGRIKSGPIEWRNLTLFVVQDYENIRVSRLVPEKGAWPPGPGQILIERDALQVARAAIGDTVTVRIGRGPERTLRVSGSVHDVGQAQARMENLVYGYITLPTLEQLGESPVLNQLKILVAEGRFDEMHIRRVAADVQSVMEARGHPVSRVDVPAPGKHPHADIMGLLLLSMSSFGVLAVVLSGVVVVNLLTALLSAQVRQIGVMKAIGATPSQVGRIYLGQALLLGSAALLVAFPAGRWGGRLLCRALAVFLNFDIASFSVPLWVGTLCVAVGLVVPLCAAAYPVWKGSRVPVREALADFGVSREAFGERPFDRFLAGRTGSARPLLLSLRNALRRRARLVLTVLTLAAGGVFFLTAWNIRASMVATLDGLFRERAFDLSVALGSMADAGKVDRAVRRTPGILRAEGWIVTDAALASAGRAGADRTKEAGPRAGGPHGEAAASSDRFQVVALPEDTRLFRPRIVEGRGLAAGDLDALVVNTSLAEKGGGLKIGQSVALAMGPAEATFHVVGIAREPFSPATAYAPLRFFEEHGHTSQFNSLRLALASTDPASMRPLRAALEENLEREGLSAVSATSQAESRYGFDQHMKMIYVFLVVVSGILAAVAGLGLATTMSLNVLERRREMGVLRAIGAGPLVIRLLIVGEALAIGLASWALALLWAWPASLALGALMSRFFRGGLDVVLAARAPLIWLAVSLLLAAAASLLPAWHAGRASVREAIEYE